MLEICLGEGMKKILGYILLAITIQIPFTILGLEVQDWLPLKGSLTATLCVAMAWTGASLIS